MYFLGLGLIFLAMKTLEIGPVALWSWWLVLSPLVLAVLWWQWADASGYTKRKASEAERKKAGERRERVQKNLEKLGQIKH